MARKNSLGDKPRGVLLASLMPEPDRGCVLVSHAFIHYRLHRSLKINFIEHDAIQSAISFLLDGPRAPLASFYVQATTLHAMGIISKENYNALRVLNELRNHFGHHPGAVELGANDVESIFEKLDSRTKELVGIFEQNKMIEASAERQKNWHCTPLRFRFARIAMSLEWAVHDSYRHLSRKQAIAQFENSGEQTRPNT